nr:hypothetical protein [Tanacetum cinerariifolium]
MHNMGKTIGKLHALLIEYEKSLPKKVATPQVFVINGGRIQKPNKKPQAKGKGKGKGHGKNKLIYAPKPKNPKPTAQSVRSSNVIALDSSYLLVLITEMSQSRQHESRKPPIAELFDNDSDRISIVIVNTKEYHFDVLAIITRIMRKTLDNSL